jgi:phage gp36-like protein
MPAYAALSDLLERFEERELVQLTDTAGTGAVDQDTVDRALTAATSTIDGFLAALYQLPLSRIPDNIVDLCCDIARFKIWQRKGTPTDAVEKANAAALKMLEQISKGIIKIDAGAREQPARDGAIVTTLEDSSGDSGRVFSRDKLRGL